MSRKTDEQDGAGRLGRPAGLPKRWSAQRKSEVVLRLLRGEDIGEVSRELRVAPPELERWRREFLQGGQEGLKGKNRPGGELMRTRAKLGEMTMRVELQANFRRSECQPLPRFGSSPASVSACFHHLWAVARPMHRLAYLDEGGAEDGDHPPDDAGEAAGRDALVVPVDGQGGGRDAQLREHGVALSGAEAASVAHLQGEHGPALRGEAARRCGTVP